jgi:hypothetical protein
MRKLEKNTRRYFVNLFSDYILSKFEKQDNTIIQVTDCETFIVVNGITTSGKEINLNDLKIEFIESFKGLFDSLGIKAINVIDIIKYEQSIETFKKGWVSVNKSQYVTEEEPILEINVSSEFPYGHSLGCGRGMYYYSHYMFNHMYNLLGIDNLYFYYSNELDEDDDYKIKISSDSKISSKRIKNLILDVFDMDITSFNEKLLTYDFLNDILDPESPKPYLIQDRLEDVILF